MLEVYKIFASDWPNNRFDEQAAIELFNNESYGAPLTPNNGYALGKKWLNVTLAMWEEDIRDCNIFKHELYEDGKFPKWWLDSVLQNMIVESTCMLDVDMQR